MRNQEAKQKFIEVYSPVSYRPISILEGYFSHASSSEDKFDKDLSEFNLAEAMQMFTNIEANSMRYLQSQNKVFKDYCEFIGLNGTIYHEMTTKQFRECLHQDSNNLITRELLSELQDRMLNETDKAISECIWIGMQGKSFSDITQLSKDNYNPEKRCIDINGKHYEVSERLAGFLDAAFAETTYKGSENGNTFRLLDDKYLCRFADKHGFHIERTEATMRQWFQKRMTRIRKHLGYDNFSSVFIRKSGFVDAFATKYKMSGLSLYDFANKLEGRQIALQYGYDIHSKSYPRSVTNILYNYLK